jgi:hypothetical protein
MHGMVTMGLPNYVFMTEPNFDPFPKPKHYDINKFISRIFNDLQLPIECVLLQLIYIDRLKVSQFANLI